MFRAFAMVGILSLAFSATANAQLPADAVMLDKVKVPEKQKSVDLCPVHLDEPSDAKLASWTHKDVAYRGHTAECQAQFDKDADKHAEAAKYSRWENNFILAMSTIWCPVTDEVNSGGGLRWEKLGIAWESCCEFCNEDVTDEDFPFALKLLKERAKESYELAGGKYTEGASSPVEGAIKLPGITEFLGSWTLEISTPSGRTFENTLSLKMEAGDLAGTLTSRRGDSELDDLRSDDEGNISFAVTRERNGQEFVMEYKGKVDGEKISGTIEIDAGGQAFEMEFTGERGEEKPAEESVKEA